MRLERDGRVGCSSEMFAWDVRVWGNACGIAFVDGVVVGVELWVLSCGRCMWSVVCTVVEEGRERRFHKVIC